MENINIKNENLANYLMFKLDKLDNSFTEQELDQITEVVINYEVEKDDSFIFLEELKKLKNLKTITLRNGFIDNDNYKIFLDLKHLSEFIFDNCGFENPDLIASLNLRSLELINCQINNYTFVSTIDSLEELSIVNGIIDIEKINLLKKLKYLQLSYSEIKDEKELNINNIEELYIDNTNIKSFDFLKKLTKLKRLSIDKKQYDNNKKLFDELMNNNILVLNENMVTFRGESDEV